VAPRDERSVPLFGALTLLVLTAALMFGLGEGFAAIYAYVHEVPLTEAERHVRGDLLTLTLAQVIAMGSALALGLRLWDPDTRTAEALSLRPVSAKTLALCLGAGACLQFPLTELANVLHAYVFGPDPLEHQIALQNLLEARSLAQGLRVVTCVVGLVPLTEELLFRGFLLFGLSRRYGRGFGLLLSSVLFGVVHLGAVPALYASVAGVVLGWLALSTRSVWPGVSLHAAFNAVPVLLPEHVVSIRGFNVPSEVQAHLSPWLVWPPLALGLLLLAGVRRIEYGSEHD
jgi:membrane protease YdiL (CAAX protease family)